MSSSGSLQDIELLNIKQAAKLLNVSEISLRRWTDAGRLPCLRVGARRERRFRREDLMAFPEQQPRTAQTRREDRDDGKDRRRHQIHIDGMSVDYGNHLCSFYETDLGRLKMAVPFLADGLRAGDICFLAASDPGQAQILSQLGSVYAGLDEAREREQLRVCDGMDSGRDMLAYFEREFVLATSAGKQMLRVLGDMAWFLDRGLDIAELADFELKYNYTLAHRFPVVSLCQYDARRFSGQGVLNALKCHEDTFKLPLQRFLGV